MNYTLVRLFVLCTVVFSSVNLKAMKVDQRIAELQLKRSQKLDGISQRARGDMTAHKALYKKAEPELNMINEEIQYLERLNVFFVGFNQLAKL
jgi:hypothetical protein